MGFSTRSTTTVTVTRPTVVDDGYGGVTPGTAATLASGYACYFFDMTPFDRDRVLTRYKLDNQAHVMKVYGGADTSFTNQLQPGDIFTITASDRTDLVGAVYEVVGVGPMHSRGFLHHLAVVVIKRK